MLKLGLTRTDVLTMPYSYAAWYVEAVASESGDTQQDGVRDATQSDIDAF